MSTTPDSLLQALRLGSASATAANDELRARVTRLEGALAAAVDHIKWIEDLLVKAGMAVPS